MTQPFNIKHDMIEKYAEAKAKNDDPYGTAIYRYLERWAALMDNQITTTGLPPAECIEKHAEDLSYKANIAGITGYMYGCAVAVLVACWEHGELLRVWHNKKYGGDSDEGTVNPALLVYETESP